MHVCSVQTSNSLGTCKFSQGFCLLILKITLNAMSHQVYTMTQYSKESLSTNKLPWKMPLSLSDCSYRCNTRKWKWWWDTFTFYLQFGRNLLNLNAQILTSFNSSTITKNSEFESYISAITIVSVLCNSAFRKWLLNKS